MSHFCFIYGIFTHTFKYHFHYYHTYMARDKKMKSHKQIIMPKKSHTVFIRV